MSTTTVKSYSSSCVGKELSKKVIKASLQAENDDIRLKTIVDGFDAIIKDTQTSKDEKELADFAKGFVGRLSCAPRNDKSILGLFRGIMHGKSSDTTLQVAAGSAFLKAIASTVPSSSGRLMTNALQDASSTMKDNSKARYLIDNGLDEICNSTKASHDEKTLAAFGKRFMKSASSDSSMARAAGSSILKAMMMLNNGPVAFAITKAIQEESDSFSYCSQSQDFISRAFNECMTDDSFSQDQKTLLTLGKDFIRKMPDKPDLRVGAGKALLSAVNNSFRPQVSPVMAAVTIAAAGNANEPGDRYEAVEDCLNEIIINAGAAQRDKTLAASGKELMENISGRDDVKYAIGSSILNTIAFADAGPVVPALAKAVKAAAEKTDEESVSKVLASGFYQIADHSEATETERSLALYGQSFSEAMSSSFTETGLWSAAETILDAIASEKAVSVAETVVKATRARLDCEISCHHEYAQQDILKTVMRVLASESQASPLIRTLAQTGIELGRCAEMMKTFQEIEKIVNGEQGVAAEFEHMAKACDGEQRPSQIETVDDKVIIDGVKISRKSLSHM